MTESQLHYVCAEYTGHYIQCSHIPVHPTYDPSYEVCSKWTSTQPQTRQSCVSPTTEGRATTYNCTDKGSISLPFSFSPTFFSLSPTHVLYLAHPQKRCLKIEARRWTGASDCHGNNVPRLQAIRPAGKLTTTAVMLQQSLLKNTVHNIWTDDDVKMFRSSKSRQDS